jgi:hypothetical protein
MREPPALRALEDDAPARDGVRVSRAFVVLVASLTLASGCAAAHKPALEPANTPASEPARRPAPQPAYAALGPGHFVRAVNDDGQYVTLEDGSVWEIEPSRRFETADWEVQAAVTVRRANADGPFTYELDNTQDDEGALARYVPR